MKMTARFFWFSLCRKIGLDERNIQTRTVHETFEELITAYSDESRYYHNIEHILGGLLMISNISNLDLVQDPNSLEMAWWWHDFVYDTKSSFNELDSATNMGITLTNLECKSDFIDKTFQLILATKHDHIPEDPDQKLIVDIDLMGLGSPPKLFDENTANIRKEYDWVSDEDFKKGRADFFRKLLAGRNGQPIYLTKYFRDSYEKQAQENLKRLINDAKAG